MPSPSLWGLLAVIALGLLFELVNGWTDAPNSIAVAVSTRVLSPEAAVVMAAVFNVLGSLSGTAVATTIGTGILQPDAVTQSTVAASLIGTIIWSTGAWYFGLPTSESHGLVAGLAGAGLATAGFGALLWDGWQKVIIGLAFSTFLGFMGAVVMMTAILWIFRRSAPARVRTRFGRLQLLSSAFMAFSHGSNDAQKTMGVITLSLLVHGFLTDFSVPLWVILLCATVMGIGTAVGGWRIIKTMGMNITKLDTVHGFAAQTTAATVIEVASRFGIPLSTTHTIGTSIMGVGASRRLSAVRWGVAGEIVAAWVLTFPVCGLIGYLAGLVFHFAFPS